MPTAPLYAEFVVAGQYDGFFRWHTSMFDPSQEDGNVEAPTGWFAVIEATSENIAAYASAGNPHASRLTPGRYLFQQDNDGIVWVHEYRSERRLLADYHRLTRLYTDWLGPAVERVQPSRLYL